MTISKSVYHQDPFEAPQASLEWSHNLHTTFSEDKFRRDLIYYAFLITSSKYLEVSYLPKRFSEED